jgi:hypothetical protein
MSDPLYYGSYKTFNGILFDKGGSTVDSCAPKVGYLTRIEILKEKIKKNKAITASLMNELHVLVCDLLTHRHTFEDNGNIAWGNLPDPEFKWPNRVSGYPAQINNQIPYAPPYCQGFVNERWFSTNGDYTHPNLLETNGVMRTFRQKGSPYLQYSSSNQSALPQGILETVGGMNNFGAAFDFFFKFPPSMVNTTVYFFVKHDDAVLMEVNNKTVVNKSIGETIFGLNLTSGNINTYIPVSVKWLQGYGNFNLDIRMCTYYSPNSSDYTSIDPSYIYSLTPIASRDMMSATTFSFYNFVQQLAALFNHNHFYTDGSSIAPLEINSLFDTLNSVHKTVTVNVPTTITKQTINSTIYNVPTIAEQLINGSAHFLQPTNTYFDYDSGKRYTDATDIVIAPFTVNL